jgi:hypothetical protein
VGGAVRNAYTCSANTAEKMKRVGCASPKIIGAVNGEWKESRLQSREMDITELLNFLRR